MVDVDGWEYVFFSDVMVQVYFVVVGVFEFFVDYFVYF